MSRPTLDQIRSVGDFATQYNWGLSFVTAPAGLDALKEPGVNIRCISTDLPKKTNEPISIKIRGHHSQQAGISDSTHVITLAMHETVDNYISELIWRWREMVSETDTGKQLTRKEVEATLLLQRHNPQNDIIWTYQLTGCSIQDYELPQLTAENGAWMPSITLKYDDFKEGPGSRV